MKKISLMLFAVLFVLSCTPKRENGNPEGPAKSTDPEMQSSEQQDGAPFKEEKIRQYNNPDDRQSASPNNDYFEGKYEVGELVYIVQPARMAFMLKVAENDPNPVYLFLTESSTDSTFVYVDKEKTMKFVMEAGHDKGMFYEDGKKWEVRRVK